MSNIVKFSDVTERIIKIRDEDVLLDSDVAFLYDVETREVNQSVKNNLKKFPNEGFVFQLTKKEKQEVIKIFDNPKIKYSPELHINFALLKFKHTIKRKVNPITK